MNQSKAGVTLLVTWLAVMSVSADWANWRGPSMNGLQGDSSLVDSLRGVELVPLWKSDPIPGGKDGGFSSPVVADGKLFVFSAWRTYFPVEYRLLDQDGANEIGLIPPSGISAGLVARAEIGRKALFRSMSSRSGVKRWVNNWIEKNLSEDQRENEAVRGYVADRLHRGDKAVPLDTLAKVHALVDKRFENQAALDLHVRQIGVDRELWDKQIGPHISSRGSRLEDVIKCLDARSGKELWEERFPAKGPKWGSSSTPCVVNGRVYVAGLSGIAYCLDASSGEMVWRSKACRSENSEINSSFAYSNNQLYILMDRLVALDAATGRLKWENRTAKGRDSSPVTWSFQDGNYVLCGGQEAIICVDAADGKSLWKNVLRGKRNSTPAIRGTIVAVGTSHGIMIYRIYKTGVCKIAESVLGGSNGSSPINDGRYIYAAGHSEVVCVEAATGRTAWRVRVANDDYSSPILSDGKLLCLSKKGHLVMFEAATGRNLGSAKIGALNYASPILTDGLLYIRTRDDIRCFDLKK